MKRTVRPIVILVSQALLLTVTGGAFASSAVVVNQAKNNSSVVQPAKKIHQEIPRTAVVSAQFVSGSGSKEKSNYHGSQADNNVLKSLSEMVNPATGSLSVSLPLLSTQGYLPVDLSLQYGAGQQGTLGLPTGWQFNLDVVVPGKSVSFDGQTYQIDPNWHDKSGNASGLKYLNEYGIHFDQFKSGRSLPSAYKDTRSYVYLLTRSDGSHDYFDGSGKLIAQDDRFGNHVRYDYLHQGSGLLNNQLTSITDSLGNVYKLHQAGGILQVTFTDSLGKSHQQVVTYNDTGVVSYKDALGMTTNVGYQKTSDGIYLLNEIDYPNGLQTTVGYDKALKYKDDQGRTGSIWVVTTLKHNDRSTGKVVNKTTYQYESDHNYTGYPAQLSATKDNLLESDNQKYTYTVTVTQSDGQDSTQYTKSRMIFNNMGVAKEVDRYLNGSDQPIFKTINQYDYHLVSHDPHLWGVNYNQPIETDQQVYDAKSNSYRTIGKTTMKYDKYGNTVAQQNEQYDPISAKMLQSVSTAETYDPRYNLETSSKTTVFNPVTNASEVSESDNVLDTEGKNISVTHSKDKQGKPWKDIAYQYDAHGLQTSAKMNWAQSGHAGLTASQSTQGYQYNANKNQIVVTKTDGAGDTITQVLDATTGNVLKEITPSGGVTTYTYDLDGRTLTKTDPLGQVMQYTYHDYGKNGVNEVVETAPNGYQKKTQYNVLNKDTAVYGTDDSSDPSKFIFEGSKTYNGLSQVLSQKDALGNVSTTRYNTLGMPVESKDPDGNETAISYDYADLSAAQSVNGIRVGQVVYNVAKKPLLSIQYANSANPNNPGYALVKQTVYDGSGQEIQVSNGTLDNGSQVMSVGHLSALVDSTGQVLRGNNQYTVLQQLNKQYDVDGNVTNETLTAYRGTSKQGYKDPLAKSTEEITFDYNLLGKLHHAIKVINGDTAHKVERDTFGYDAAGHLLRDTNALGDVVGGHIDYQYDKDGHKILETRLDQKTQIHYAYDKDGQLIAKAWQDYNGGDQHKITYRYDKAGNMIEASETINGGTPSVMKYSYTLNGKLTSTTYPDGKQSTQKYNAQGQLTDITDVNGLNAHYQYYDDGKLQQVTKDGHKVAYTYHTGSGNADDNHQYGSLASKTVDSLYVEVSHVDGLGRVTDLDKTAVGNSKKRLLNVTRQYNAKGEVTNEHMLSDLRETDQNVNYSKYYFYDNLGELVQEAKYSLAMSPLTLIDYAYDANGNITKKVDTGLTTTYQYNELDQLVRYIEDGQTYTPNYNKNGDEVTDGKGTEYHYNGLSQLAQVDQASSSQGELLADAPKTIIRYSYYPNGARATRTVVSQPDTVNKNKNDSHA